MALNTLTLSVTDGVQGKPFEATIGGLTTGKLEILGDASPGFSTVNGRIRSDGLPYTVTTLAVREYEPGVGAGYKDSRIDINAVSDTEIKARAMAAIGDGRKLVNYGVAGDRLTASFGYSIAVMDDLGATTIMSLAGPFIDIDLTANTAMVDGIASTVAANLTATRADATAYALDTDGVFKSFAANTLRRTGKGLFAGPAVIQLAQNGCDIGQYSAVSGATKETLAGTVGPFTRTRVVSGGDRQARLGRNATASWTAGSPYTVAFWYQAGTSQNVYMRIQQTFGGSQSSLVTGRIGKPLGQIASAGAVYGIETRALVPTLLVETRFTFIPDVTGLHQLAIGPGSTTIGEDIIACGVFAAAGAVVPEAIASSTSSLTRAADNIAFAGPLAAAIAAASGSIVIDVEEVHGSGDILVSGSGGANKLLTAAGRNEVTSTVGSARLQGTANAGDLMSGTVVYEWDDASRRMVMNAGYQASDASPPADRSAAALLSGVTGYVKRIRVYKGRQWAQRARRAPKQWKRIRAASDGGGFITGVDIASDNTKYYRGDVWGCYRMLEGETVGTQLMTASRFPPAFRNLNMAGGCVEIVSAPSDPDFIYMMKSFPYLPGAPSKLFRSRNGREACDWEYVSTFADVANMDSNRTNRLGGPYIANDPKNKNHAYAATPQGLRRTTDGWATYTTIAALGTPDTFLFAIVFDPASPVVDGLTQGVYIFKGGTGLYRSVNAGVDFAAVAGGPTSFKRIAIASTGKLWIAPNAANSSIISYDGANFATVSVAGAGATNRTVSGIAIDPSNPNKLACVYTSAGLLTYSVDGGANWTGWSQGAAISAPDIVWQEFTNERSMSTSDLKFDRNGDIWLGEGIGLWKATLGVPNADYVVWEARSRGIDIFVMNDILSVKGGRNYALPWDRQVIPFSNPDVSGRTHGVDATVVISHGWSADSAPENPDAIFIVANTDSPLVARTSGYTLDGGRTWTKFAVDPASFAANKTGGQIVAGSVDKIAVATSYNGPLIYSSDRGANWATLAATGIATSGEIGWGPVPFQKRFPIAADKLNPGTIWGLNYGGASTAGLYKWVNGAAGTRKYTGTLPGLSSTTSYKIKLKPGTSDDIWYTGGNGATSTLTAPSAPSYSFCRFTPGSDGTAFTTIPNVCEVWDFDWDSSGNLYILGFVRQAGAWLFGFWRSRDDGQNWEALAVGSDYFPNDSLDLITCVEADKNIPGRLFVGFVGSASVYCDFGP